MTTETSTTTTPKEIAPPPPYPAAYPPYYGPQYQYLQPVIVYYDPLNANRTFAPPLQIQHVPANDRQDGRPYLKWYVTCLCVMVGLLLVAIITYSLVKAAIKSVEKSK